MLITQLDTYSGLGGFLLNTPVSMYTLSDVNQLVCYLLTYNNPILQIWEWGFLNRPIFVHKGTPDSLVSPANPLVAGQFVIRYMPCRLAICVKFWSFTVQNWSFPLRISSVNVTKTRSWSHLLKKSSVENFIFRAALSPKCLQ